MTVQLITIFGFSVITLSVLLAAINLSRTLYNAYYQEGRLEQFMAFDRSVGCAVGCRADRERLVPLSS